MVIFVSEIEALSNKTTSTHILTENIIYGLKQTGYEVIFIAICETPESCDNVKKYYTDIVDELYIFKSRFSLNNSKFSKLFSMLKGVVLRNGYKFPFINKLNSEKETILLSHMPSYEALFVCREVLTHYPNMRYIQYWSDPIALSGIMPEGFNYKRFPFYLLEKYAYKFADEIVFGTETLLNMSAELYPKYKDNMRYVDIAYLHTSSSPSMYKDRYKFIYAGNYYSSIRNIKPLYDAFSELNNKYSVDIYGSGDVNLPQTENVKFHNRVSPEELVCIENGYRNTISLLNHSCLQIPGKTFYRTNTDQVILVIADGIHKAELTKYLAKYNRFCICDNNKEDIKRSVEKIAEIEKFCCPENIIDILSPEYVSKRIVEGDK